MSRLKANKPVHTKQNSLISKLETDVLPGEIKRRKHPSSSGCHFYQTIGKPLMLVAPQAMTILFELTLSSTFLSLSLISLRIAFANIVKDPSLEGIPLLYFDHL